MTVKRCTGLCKQEYPDTFEYFYKSSTTGRTEQRCKRCRNTERRNIYRDWRILALSRYSSGVPMCACCGESAVEFLALDHENGGGNSHRKDVPAALFPKWLHDHGWPPGYRVLCHSCNQAHGSYGYCPHTQHTPHLSPTDLASIVSRVAAAERAAG